MYTLWRLAVKPQDRRPTASIAAMPIFLIAFIASTGKPQLDGVERAVVAVQGKARRSRMVMPVNAEQRRHAPPNRCNPSRALPIEQRTMLESIVNMKTAAALGSKLSRSILVRAARSN